MRQEVIVGVVSDSPVHFARGEAADTDTSQVAFVALVDLFEGKVFALKRRKSKATFVRWLTI
jgi:hypothetical protein